MEAKLARELALLSQDTDVTAYPGSPVSLVTVEPAGGDKDANAEPEPEEPTPLALLKRSMDTAIGSGDVELVARVLAEAEVWDEPAELGASLTVLRAYLEELNSVIGRGAEAAAPEQTPEHTVAQADASSIESKFMQAFDSAPATPPPLANVVSVQLPEPEQGSGQEMRPKGPGCNEEPEVPLEVLRVTVPDGVAAGQLVYETTAKGQQIEVEVPNDVQTGEEFDVEVPTAIDLQMMEPEREHVGLQQEEKLARLGPELALLQKQLELADLEDAMPQQVDEQQEFRSPASTTSATTTRTSFQPWGESAQAAALLKPAPLALDRQRREKPNRPNKQPSQELQQKPSTEPNTEANFMQAFEPKPQSQPSPSAHEPVDFMATFTEAGPLGVLWSRYVDMAGRDVACVKSLKKGSVSI